MARKKHKPMDPAEIARKAYLARRNPAEWGVNLPAMTLAQNAGVRSVDATREKVQRITRYDCFALLQSRGAIDEVHVGAVRRLMDLIEARFRLGSLNPTEKVDGAAAPDKRTGVTVASLQALADIEAVLTITGALSAKLLIALCEPAVRNGQPINNWRGVVERETGQHYVHGQIALVRTACENLRLAWTETDNAVKKRAAA